MHHADRISEQDHPKPRPPPPPPPPNHHILTAETRLRHPRSRSTATATSLPPPKMWTPSRAYPKMLSDDTCWIGLRRRWSPESGMMHPCIAAPVAAAVCRFQYLLTGRPDARATGMATGMIVHTPRAIACGAHATTEPAFYIPGELLDQEFSSPNALHRAVLPQIMADKVLLSSFSLLNGSLNAPLLCSCLGTFMVLPRHVGSDLAAANIYSTAAADQSAG